MNLNSSSHRLRLATRESPLALWQADHVAGLLKSAVPELQVDIVAMTTEGDMRTATPLASIGGKGLFMKELELALVAGEADIAVHSMKDVTVELPEGLMIAAACVRGEPRDALVSNNFASFDSLPKGSRVGTSSLRRKCQLRHAFPELEYADLRGNVNTRLGRLDAGEYDAIVLAGAGLVRLGLRSRISELITEEVCLPAVGQGIVGIECRADDTRTRELVTRISDPSTELCLAAERSLNEALGGGCHVPVAGFAVLEGQELFLRGRVGDPEGGKLLVAEARGNFANASDLGGTVAGGLLEQGADAVLEAVYQEG